MAGGDAPPSLLGPARGACVRERLSACSMHHGHVASLSLSLVRAPPPAGAGAGARPLTLRLPLALALSAKVGMKVGRFCGVRVHGLHHCTCVSRVFDILAKKIKVFRVFVETKLKKS